jgi:hypothetical protein
VTALRPDVERLVALGKMPPREDASIELVDTFEAAIRALPEPLTDDEAEALVEAVLSDDDLEELRETLITAIRTAPAWSNRNDLW